MNRADPRTCQHGDRGLGNHRQVALLRTIEKFHGNMISVATHLGISRNTLYRKIKRHSIKIARHPEDH